ncbi:glycoside hydrolase family 99-like domain-containing protein [Polluticoccus soli]|uniref:glycosyltransferase WbsX family protein n=1 Tax=Polluticoccus soli TaxID=3034150 RepID=UPI0023E1C553|nr:glycoside hydrolase family 99-like domain-containing protein [Flavipsychrobacter sp. JY13-12]
MSLRPIAIHLPQYHPVPENDEWWGKGFTEWTNVTKAKPLFDGHYQPQLPADLGFYDLRLPEVREAQARMAAEYGIYGFCYYHYWFNGRRILERPVQEIFESGKPDFPFMLCWANENWTRIWDGGDNEILLQQHYSQEDDIQHIRSLIPYFKDDRYIKVDGKPVFAIYKSPQLPDVKRTIATWREEARKEGLELYLCRFESFTWVGEKYVKESGFDAGIDFQPFGIGNVNEFREQRNKNRKKNITAELKRKAKLAVLKEVDKDAYKRMMEKDYYLIDYEQYVDYLTSKPFPDYNWFPGITPGWDNSSRRKVPGLVLHNSTPGLYGKWLKHIKDNYKPKSEQENFVFVNAWNEWAEGNHLEPCQKWGRSYLEETKKVLAQ